MADSLTLEQKKSRRGLLALVGAGGAAALGSLLGRSNGAEAAPGDNFILGVQTNDAGSQITKLTANLNDVALYVDNNSTGEVADGIKSETSGEYGWAVYGMCTGSGGVGVRGGCSGAGGTGVMGINELGPGVEGYGKPGVYGFCNTNNGSGVRGDGDGPGTIGVFAKNTPGRRALRTKGQVQMDCARTVTLSARSTKVTLPTGTRAGTNAVVLATTQGNPGNDAYIWRAYRVDSTHVRIVFNKAPANPVSVAYWVVHTG